MLGCAVIIQSSSVPVYSGHWVLGQRACSRICNLDLPKLTSFSHGEARMRYLTAGSVKFPFPTFVPDSGSKHCSMYFKSMS